MSHARNISLKSYIVTPKELSDALTKNVHTKISTAPRVIPVCAAWFLPNDPQGRTGHQVFKEQRIPSARFFDLDAVKDHDSPYPHMLPTAEGFAEAMRKLGIRRDDEVVVYDTKELGIFSAPRVGWTFQVSGHPGVHLLNNFRLHNKEGAEEVQVLDARSRGRWAGTDPEPRPGLSSGHMPGSISIPHSELLDPKTGALLSGEELRRVFQSKGVKEDKPIISSCGTGVTAAVIDAALGEAKYGREDDRRLYDGSWTEWAQRVSDRGRLIRKEL